MTKSLSTGLNRRRFMKQALGMIGASYGAVSYARQGFQAFGISSQNPTAHNQNAALDKELTHWLRPLMNVKSEGELLVYKHNDTTFLYGSVQNYSDKDLCERLLQSHPQVKSIQNHIRYQA